MNSGISFLSSRFRQFAPGMLLIVVLMPIWASDSWTRTAIGSLIVAKPWSKKSGVSNPLARPASAMSALARAMSVLYGEGRLMAEGVGGDRVAVS